MPTWAKEWGGRGSFRYLPHALVANAAVAVLPAAAGALLKAEGVIASTAASMAVGMALSLAAAYVGSVCWSRWRGSSDVVFSDLMFWGWIRRLRAERRLARTVNLLGELASGPDSSTLPLERERRAELLAQLSTALEAGDPYTHGHSRRVARHAEMIARQLRLAPAQVAQIRLAAAVHDVGKLKTPREILHKPGRLTDEEFAVIKRHPVDGAEMVASLGDPDLVTIVRSHHERIDGRGYPDGLPGGEIPLGSRIIAVADTFDALTSTRPYRSANPHRRALDVLRAERGRQLDADAVDAFLAYYSGRRRVAWWSVLTTAPPRLSHWFAGFLQGAGAANATAAFGTAAIAAGALGGAAPLASESDALAGAGRAGVAARVQPRDMVRAAEQEGERTVARRPPQGGDRAPARKKRRAASPPRPTDGGGTGGPAPDTGAGPAPGHPGPGRQDSEPQGTGAPEGGGGGGGQPPGGGGSTPPTPGAEVPTPIPPAPELPDLPDGPGTPSLDPGVPGVPVP